MSPKTLDLSLVERGGAAYARQGFLPRPGPPDCVSMKHRQSDQLCVAETFRVVILFGNIRPAQFERRIFMRFYRLPTREGSITFRHFREMAKTAHNAAKSARMGHEGPRHDTRGLVPIHHFTLMPA